eukprot:3840892-Pyramimonas_sp.AAC.1
MSDHSRPRNDTRPITRSPLSFFGQELADDELRLVRPRQRPLGGVEQLGQLHQRLRRQPLD